MAAMPCGENELHDTPATEPEVPTHTSLFLIDAATVFGKVPGTGTGLPIIVSEVVFFGSIANIVTVFDPALTANRYYKECLLAERFRMRFSKSLDYHTLPAIARDD